MITTYTTKKTLLITLFAIATTTTLPMSKLRSIVNNFYLSTNKLKKSTSTKYVKVKKSSLSAFNAACWGTTLYPIYQNKEMLRNDTTILFLAPVTSQVFLRGAFGLTNIPLTRLAIAATGSALLADSYLACRQGKLEKQLFNQEQNIAWVREKGSLLREKSNTHFFRPLKEKLEKYTQELDNPENSNKK